LQGIFFDALSYLLDNLQQIKICRAINASTTPDNWDFPPTVIAIQSHCRARIRHHAGKHDLLATPGPPTVTV